MRQTVLTLAVLLLPLLLSAQDGEELAEGLVPRSGNSEAVQGQEEDLASDPFTFGASVQGGFIHNFRGGIKRGSDYMGRVHLTLNFSTEAAGLWKGGEFKINAVNAHGGTPTERLIGDFQPISRNEATERTGLFELWYKQSFGNSFILLGQHDMNSSFGTSAGGGMSINSAFGMYPSITPNTGFAFSIFPRTMPAIYFRHDLKHYAFQAAVYAGASHDFDQDRYNIRWNLSESQFYVGELHYKAFSGDQERGLYKLGIIKHTGDFQDVTDPSGVQTTRAGVGLYVIADHLVLPEAGDNDQGLALFFQGALTRGDHNLIDRFLSAGIVYRGLIPGRERDKLFLSALNSSINDDIPENTYLDVDLASRTIIEMNYAARLGEQFTLQPDLQYIINPGANSSLGNSLLGILRFSIDY